jgi:hypothetical protein
LQEFSFAVLTSIVASLIVAYLTARITVGSRYGEAAKRLFVAVMQYYFAYKALVVPGNLEKVDDGAKFKATRDEDVYLNNLEGVLSSVKSILNSPASSELLKRNLQVAALPISLEIEIYNFKQTKLISNKTCLKDMFEVMDFLLKEKVIRHLSGQKIHNEVVKIQNELNDSYLVDLLGFNPNAGI